MTRRLRRRRPRQVLPLADRDSFAALARRTRAERALMLGAVAALVAGCVLLADRPVERHRALVPRDTTAIVVLDLSSSISSDTYNRIQSTLNDLSHTRGRYGVVIFSDVAYQALPPGTPAIELKAFVRYFVPIQAPADSGQSFSFPASPWLRSFSGGTKISAGLAKARELITTQRLKNASVLLVSDLSDDTGDLGRVAEQVISYEDDGIALRVIGLNPSPEDEHWFQGLLGRNGVVEQSRLPTQPSLLATSFGTGFPYGLAAAAAALAVLLGLALAASGRLEWREEAA